ncbi:MAG: hypothetical protein KA764_15385 [Anaerolineales bacterium]|nr:hypothetical protein [Anaerolineales bacterium]
MVSKFDSDREQAMGESCGCESRSEAAGGGTRPIADAACPTNHQVGKAVETTTLKALLARPLTELRPVAYRFCKAPDCPTVYYSVDGSQTFAEADLRETVYQKHTRAVEQFVCYCFRHTLASIRAEIEQTGRSTVPAQITAGIQAGQCACDIRNPQGRCCLGNVQQLVRQLEQNFQLRRSTSG